MSTVVSKDGTRIGYQRSGNGPAVILVDGAFCSRAFGPMPKLALKWNRLPRPGALSTPSSPSIMRTRW